MVSLLPVRRSIYFAKGTTSRVSIRNIFKTWRNLFLKAALPDFSWTLNNGGHLFERSTGVEGVTFESFSSRLDYR